MLKRRNIIITWVITALVLLAAGLYIASILWALSLDGNVPGLVRWGLIGVILLIFVPFMVMMVITALRRRKEIEEEHDDLGKY